MTVKSDAARSDAAEMHVFGFRARGGTGRLASDRAAMVQVEANVQIPEDQASGTYRASYPVTIAYN